MKIVLTVRLVIAMAALLAGWANPAAADLYRWVDPETGSVKFSSYPPPWFGDPAKENRAPKVEQIPAGRSAPAIGGTIPEAQPASKPASEPGAKLQAPASSSLEDRRKLLLKQIAAQAAGLGAAKPEEGGRLYSELAERVREYQSAEQYLAQVDAGGEAARRAEWADVVAGVEGRRRKMLEQLSNARVPEEGASADGVRAAWLDLGRQVASFSTLEDALKLLDPRGAAAREAELAALTGKITQQWKPFLDAVAPRRAQ